jgi:membrane fusion protein (multidrug efflux system)
MTEPSPSVDPSADAAPRAASQAAPPVAPRRRWTDWIRADWIRADWIRVDWIRADWTVRLAAVLVAGVIVILFTTQWNRWVGNATREETDDAYVRGDVTPLSAQVDGYVRHVAVDDFQYVKAGDLLVQIDDADYRARVAQAEANLAGAEAAIENIKARKASQKAQVANAGAAIAAGAADSERARLESTRQRALLATTYGTQQKVEQADADAKRLAAILVSKQAELEAQHRQLAVLDTEESALRAATKAKEAALDLAKINLGYTRIAAPVTGVVSERGVRDGQYVHAGTQVISVVPLENVWVTANFKETQLTHVTVGQGAEIRVDTFPGVVVGARVAAIAPASGSQFSLLPPDNATGNFTKVVQRIPVKLSLAAKNPLAGRLRPGMSVEATILTDTTPPL